MHFDFDLDGENKEQIKQITSLVQEFSIPAGAGNMSVLERWFAELGVTWVLHLGDGASAAAMLAHAFDNALAKITETISLMVTPKIISLMGSLLCSDSDRGSVALPSIGEEAEPETANGKEEATAVLLLTSYLLWLRSLEKILLAMGPPGYTTSIGSMPCWVCAMLCPAP